jgi:hypothetical protein
MQESRGTNGFSSSGSESTGTYSSTTSKPDVSQAANQVQDAVAPVLDQAKQQGINQLSGQKDRAADTLGGVAGALRQTGSNLRGGDQDFVADYIDRAASELERFSTQLRERDVEEIFGEVESFARRQPAIILGAAYALGLLASRFLKSGRPVINANGSNGYGESNRDRGTGAWSTSAGRIATPQPSEWAPYTPDPTPINTPRVDPRSAVPGGSTSGAE